MPIDDVAAFMVNICKAAGFAHQQGLIHRDINPSNIILSVYEHAILMDFGIAKIVGGQQHTTTGATVGTAAHMSPEQIMGTNIDPRSEVYSREVSLFEMVSGHPPFEADAVMTMLMMHFNDPIPHLLAINPDVPQGLIAVITKALAKSREDRYQTAGEMASALKNFPDQPTVVPLPPIGLEHTTIEDEPPFTAAAAATIVEMSDDTLVEPGLVPLEAAVKSSLPPLQPPGRKSLDEA